MAAIFQLKKEGNKEKNPKIYASSHKHVILLSNYRLSRPLKSKIIKLKVY